MLKSFYVTILAARSMCLARNFSRLQNARPSCTLLLVYRCITKPVVFHVKHSRTEVESNLQFLHNFKLSVDRPANSWDTIVVRRERPSQTPRRLSWTSLPPPSAPLSSRAFCICTVVVALFITILQRVSRLTNM